ncbi:MAG TPA: hypothetical protein PLH19_11865 [Anaerolineae bacterium]|nr:hypothetical protein [Anaerolineae bacterium]HQH39214.1 hypothetical protein [Anaerolineae bacterium]
MMRTRLKLQPGMRGTKKLVEKYGDRLVCVRYRYDAALGKRYKTVELIEEEAAWLPQAEIAPETLLAVRVEYAETELRQQVKAAGGWWNSAQKVWELRYDQVVRLGLAERIVPREAAVEAGGIKSI